MTEEGFWKFLEGRGKADMVLYSTETGDPDIDAAGEFIRGHALLPEDYNNLTERELEEMGELLFREKVKQKTKEAVLILLAHQVSDTALTILTKFNMRPDKPLVYFARLALEESLMWNGNP
ncbi:MAG: hypothetical protein M0R00_06590 [Candidatus Omnitrophica bacterium]|jgi:hypothetical protein|nr:hypothetical protein [Candidatus Omnitrophota bacterium]